MQVGWLFFQHFGATLCTVLCHWSRGETWTEYAQRSRACSSLQPAVPRRSLGACTRVRNVLRMLGGDTRAWEKEEELSGMR